ncbi:DNA gyrase inhibitor YacG [Halotalea alkalilenta]|uniref:DNA gyrase inhibitor YacG n=1 Tax=Halotalea alkalilenta TaxID=376489 RepID=UPI000487111A|nr:DNA gyrase inhibitor YacG [Halotalea alkalilenta]
MSKPRDSLKVACPQCATQVPWNEQSPYRPFCSKRCKLLDLGAWANESHRIPGEMALDETDIDAMLESLERGQEQR